MPLREAAFLAVIFSSLPLSAPLAATLTNNTDRLVTVITQTAEVKRAVKLAPGDTYDSGESDVSLMYDYKPWVHARAHEIYKIEGGFIALDVEAMEKREEERKKEGLPPLPKDEGKPSTPITNLPAYR